MAMPIEAVRNISFSPSVIGARSVPPHGFGEGRDPLRLVLRDQQKRELVAGKPGEGVLLLEQPGEAPRDRQQDRVADRDAEAVVDLLEPVDVENEDRRPRRILGRRPRDRGAEAVEEELPVGQAGEVVVHCVVQQPLLGVALLGHVEQRADAAQHLAVRAEHRPGAEVEPPIMPVLGAQPEILRDAPRGAVPPPYPAWS